jgi:hypothetical protein
MRSTRVSYGWYAVATLCITETVTWGIVYYGFPRRCWSSAWPSS